MSAPESRQGRLIERFFRNSPFANDPFFSNRLSAGRGQPVRIHSKAISIEVQPRPVSAGNTWLPAEQLTLQDSWADTPPQFIAGQPVTRTIQMQAKGLSGTQLPALQLEQPEETRLYPESPVNESRTDGDKLYGISKQTFTYIPGKAGQLTIPAIELNWWNTRTNQAASARLPRWEINVEPGIEGTQTPATSKPGDMIQTTATENAAPDLQTASTNWQEQLKSFKHWPAAGGALLFLIIALLAAKWLRQTRPAAHADKQEKPATRDTLAIIKKLVPEFERACAADDARAAAHTLLELGHARWPDDPPNNLVALASRIEYGSTQIMELDRALYATGTDHWKGAGLCNAVKDIWGKKPANNKVAVDSLKPLYPQNT